MPPVPEDETAVPEFAAANDGSDEEAEEHIKAETKGM